MQTHLVYKIMHQNLAINLRQKVLHYIKKLNVQKTNTPIWI